MNPGRLGAGLYAGPGGAVSFVIHDLKPQSHAPTKTVVRKKAKNVIVGADHVPLIHLKTPTNTKSMVWRIVNKAMELFRLSIDCLLSLLFFTLQPR